MSTVKLRNEKTKKVRVKRTTKQALWARKCDNCGRVFYMPASGYENGRITILMGKALTMFDNRHVVADICSIDCASAIFHGGWKRLKSAKSYKKAKIKPLSADIRVAKTIQFEDELVREWKEKPESKCDSFTFSPDSATITLSAGIPSLI